MMPRAILLIDERQQLAQIVAELYEFSAGRNLYVAKGGSQCQKPDPT